MKSRIFGALALFMILFIALTSLFLLPSSADGEAFPKAENCRAACLYDKTHGTMVYVKNASERLHTSTSAKVMTGLLACEQLAKRLDETVTVTEAMLGGASGYSMGLRAGEKMKIEDLLYGAICGSYNDAAYAVASICAGTPSGFAMLMNERARELGALSTHYTDPLGYPDSDMMMTTLADTLKIALEASDNELYMKISSAKSHVIKANGSRPETTVHNRNLLVSSWSSQSYYDPACLGMNAGSSGDGGGWSVITEAHDEGVEYICIILGGRESEEGEIYAYSIANDLIRTARERFNMQKVFDKGDVLGHAEISMTALGDQEVDCIASDDLSVYLPKGGGEITYRLEYKSDMLRAPIRAGESIGKAYVYYDNALVGECDITVTEDIESNAFTAVISAIGGYTKSRAFIAAVIFFAASLTTALIIFKKRRMRAAFFQRK